MPSQPSKAANKAPTGKPFVKDDPRINRTIPGTGRPPDEFKAWMASMASSKAVQDGLDAILANPSSPLFLGAVKHVTEHGYGKPKESREVAGNVTVTVRYANE